MKLHCGLLADGRTFLKIVLMSPEKIFLTEKLKKMLFIHRHELTDFWANGPQVPPVWLRALRCWGLIFEFRLARPRQSFKIECQAEGRGVYLKKVISSTKGPPLLLLQFSLTKKRHHPAVGFHSGNCINNFFSDSAFRQGRNMTVMHSHVKVSSLAEVNISSYTSWQLALLALSCHI